jgi:hypothetical protein
MTGLLVNNEFEGNRSKWSWPSSRSCPGLFLKGLGSTSKTLCVTVYEQRYESESSRYPFDGDSL